MLRPALRVLVAALALLLAAPVLAAPAVADEAPIEDYAAYQPQTHCSPRAKPGRRTWGAGSSAGTAAASGRSRGPAGAGAPPSTRRGGPSTGPWTRRRRPTASAPRRSWSGSSAPTRTGTPTRWARRMGIMYLIWNDHMYPAWNGFEAEPYLSSSCKSRRQVLHDAAAPQPPAHLAEPRWLLGPHQLVRGPVAGAVADGSAQPPVGLVRSGRPPRPAPSPGAGPPTRRPRSVRRACRGASSTARDRVLTAIVSARTRSSPTVSKPCASSASAPSVA